MTLNDYDIYYDEYIFKYYSNLYDQEIYSYYDLEELLKQIITEKMKNEDYQIIIEDFNFNDELYKNTFLNDVPSLENIKNFIEIKFNEIIINKKFNNNESSQFCDFIINIYENTNYKEDILWFTFNYNNPFSTSPFYKNAGYLKNAGDLFLVYVDATPIHVNK